MIELHRAFDRLAEFPDIGRHANNIRSGYWQMDFASLAIFYRSIESGVLIVRVLLARMDFAQHL